VAAASHVRVIVAAVDLALDLEGAEEERLGPLRLAARAVEEGEVVEAPGHVRVIVAVGHLDAGDRQGLAAGDFRPIAEAVVSDGEDGIPEGTRFRPRQLLRRRCRDPWHRVCFSLS